jgi:hypothetical protein
MAAYYIRFRLIPGDRGTERRRFPEVLRANGVTTAVAWLDDQRSEKFMREDFKVKVTQLGVRYILQTANAAYRREQGCMACSRREGAQARGSNQTWDESFPKTGNKRRGS